MGINITDLVKPCYKPIPIESLKNKIITIDAFNWIYQFLATIRGVDGNPLKDFQNRVTSHLNGLFYRNVYLLKQGIKPIYVFDGKPNPLKQVEINRRRALRKIAEEKVEDIKETATDKEIKTYAQATSRLNSDMINDAKLLISALGIPIVQAIEDGEAQASMMIQHGHAWACGSQDYDAFLFGANRIVRNLSVGMTRIIKGRSVKTEMEYYSMEKVFPHLAITREQLVDMGILIGVDFFAGIKGIGAKTALELISKYQNIEAVIAQKHTQYDFSALTPEFITSVRNIFLQPKYTADFTLQWKRPNKDKIVELLVEQHNFNKDRVDNTLKEILLTKGVQHDLNFLFKK